MHILYMQVVVLFGLAGHTNDLHILTLVVRIGPKMQTPPFASFCPSPSLNQYGWIYLCSCLTVKTTFGLSTQKNDKNDRKYKHTKIPRGAWSRPKCFFFTWLPGTFFYCLVLTSIFSLSCT